MPLIIMIAISLSMDAFSLALLYGTTNINRQEAHKIALAVGTFHFLMPMIGLLFGHTILFFIPVNPNVLIFIVLFFIGLEMIIDSFKSMQISKMKSIIEVILFAFAVSIDSFSIGIGLEGITNKHIETSIVFALFSSIFTYIGLFLGKKITNKIGKISTIIGGITLMLIAISYLI